MKFLCSGSSILIFPAVQTTNLRNGSINFSSACHAVSWLRYSVCLPYGCRRLPLTLALCFDSVLHVLWTPGCDVNLNGETVKVPLSGWEWYKVTEILFNSVAGHSLFNQALNYTQTRTDRRLFQEWFIAMRFALPDSLTRMLICWCSPLCGNQCSGPENINKNWTYV